jgi:hypothetical protein
MERSSRPVWSATIIREPIASTRSDAIYWIVVIGGGLVAANRYAPMFRYRRDATCADSPLDRAGAPRGGHDGHVYIGTIDVEGSFKAIGTGTVGVKWARKHPRPNGCDGASVEKIYF